MGTGQKVAGCTLCVRLRRSFRLFGHGKSLECCVIQFNIIPGGTVHIHRFDEIINGREYHIEVSSVGLGKWRAQIARLPGGSAALMPFYGNTPDEAAQHLSRWLTLAHGQKHLRQ